MRRPPVRVPVRLLPLRAVHQPVRRLLHVEVRKLLDGVAAVARAVLDVQPAVQDGRVGRVQLALEGLHPVALVDEAAVVLPLLLRHQPPLELRQAGRVLLVGAHVAPRDPAEVRALVRRDVHLVLEVAGGRLVGHLDAVAVHVELPAVVGAAQPARLVPAEEEARAPVRAPLLRERHVAVGVAPGQQVLAQQPDALRLPVDLQLPRVRGGEPVLPHQLAHRRAGAYSTEQVRLFLRQHLRLLISGAAVMLVRL